MDQKAFPDTVVEFLKNNKIAVLATVSSEHIPDAALVYYIHDEKYTLFIATFQGSKKIKNIDSNTSVALVIGPEEREATLQIRGKARVVQETAFKASLVEKLASVANSNPDLLHFPPLLALSSKSSMEFIEIMIESFKYSNFTSHENNIIDGKPYEWTNSSL